MSIPFSFFTNNIPISFMYCIRTSHALIITYKKNYALSKVKNNVILSTRLQGLKEKKRNQNLCSSCQDICSTSWATCQKNSIEKTAFKVWPSLKHLKIVIFGFFFMMFHFLDMWPFSSVPLFFFHNLLLFLIYKKPVWISNQVLCMKEWCDRHDRKEDIAI